MHAKATPFEEREGEHYREAGKEGGRWRTRGERESTRGNGHLQVAISDAARLNRNSCFINSAAGAPGISGAEAGSGCVIHDLADDVAGSFR